MNIGGKHLVRLHGIFAGKAGGAESAFCVLCKLDNMLSGKVAQRISPDHFIDLLDRAAGGHQQLLIRDVSAEVAGVLERRCRHHKVHLGGTGIPQQLDDAGRCGAAHDGIIHQHHTLALDRAGNDVQLDAHAVLALLLAALNEGAADVLILNKADAMDCTIESFTWGENDGTKDINFTLEFKEYRKVKVKTSKRKEKVTKKVTAAATQRTAKAVNSTTYTVKKGDCLSMIAKNLTGSSANWRAIYNQNKGVIGGNPNLIYPGQNLVINV